MSAFKIHLNGKSVCTAGLPGAGVLGAHVSWVRLKNRSRKAELSLHVGGLDSRAEEHLVWHEALPMRVGDEIRIKVVAVAQIDEPSARKRADAAADRRARENYVRKMAKQLGWKLVIPR